MADGHSGSVRRCLRQDGARSHTGGRVAMPTGRRPFSPYVEAAVACGAAVPDPCPAARHTSCRVRGAASRPRPGSALVAGVREADGQPFGRQIAADASMATSTSLATCAGHQPSGRRSFRKQRTVNPPIAPRYKFLYDSSRPACGRHRHHRRRGPASPHQHPDLDAFRQSRGWQPTGRIGAQVADDARLGAWRGLWAPVLCGEAGPPSQRPARGGISDCCSCAARPTGQFKLCGRRPTQWR
jgi:hypothetical protein